MMQNLRDRLLLSTRNLRTFALATCMTAMPLHLLTNSSATNPVTFSAKERSDITTVAYGTELFSLEEKADTSYFDLKKQYVGANRWHGKRLQTTYIVLHLTDGPYYGSKDWIKRHGLAHHLVPPSGKYIDKFLPTGYIANHAGVSIFDGYENISRISTGTEITAPSQLSVPVPAQIPAIAETVRQLQTLYGIPDSNVLVHTQVAVDEVNGTLLRHYRRKCGVKMTTPEFRALLNLGPGRKFDPDVYAGRVHLGPTHEDTLFHAEIYPEAPYLSWNKQTNQQPPLHQLMVKINVDTIANSYSRTNFPFQSPVRVDAITKENVFPQMNINHSAAYSQEEEFTPVQK